MTPKSRHITSVQPEPALRWVFQRGPNTLTCELDVHPNRSCDVCLMPHWKMSSAVIEHFETPRSAMLRHAEVAGRLRERGWILTDHVRAHHAPAAA